MDKEPIMMTLKDAARRTGLSYYCLRQLCLTNRIAYIKSGSKYYVNYARLLAFLNQED